MNKKLFCKMLAESLMYGSTLKTFEDVILLVESKGFKIRKNKTIIDLNKCISKSKRFGNFRTESEQRMLETYLELDFIGGIKK